MSDKLSRLLAAAIEIGASDLHLIVGVPPAFRINGEIIFADSDQLTPEESSQMTLALLNSEQRKKFDREWELCISLPHSVAGRIRVTQRLPAGGS